MENLDTRKVLKPINSTNICYELKKWIQYRYNLIMTGKNQAEIIKIREEEENRLRNRIKVGKNIKIVAEENGDYQKITEELKCDENKKRLVIGGGAAYGVVSFLVAKDLVESGVNFDSLVGSSSGSIVALLLATNNLDIENIDYFIEGLDKEISPSKLGFFVAIKLLPFCTNFYENNNGNKRKLSIEEKKKICSVLIKNINKKQLPPLLSNGEIDTSAIAELINNSNNRTAIEIVKHSFNDISRIYDKKLSAMSTIITKRKRKKGGGLILPKPEKIEFKGGYPVLDGILHSCGASGFIDKKKVKNLKLLTLDSMFAGGQYQNEFSKTDKYSNVLIHTDWFFGIMRLFLAGYGDNNFVINPRLFGTDCYDSSPKSIKQLTDIANKLVGKNN